VFSFSKTNLRHSVSDKFFHFHYFKFNQLFYVKIPRLNLAIESKINEHIFMPKGQRSNLNFKHVWVISLYCQITGGSASFRGEGTYAFEPRVHGFESMGYIVSREPEYGVGSFSLPHTSLILRHYLSFTYRLECHHGNSWTIWYEN